MKLVCSITRIGILAMLVVLTCPHQRCAGKSGMSAKNIGNFDQALSRPQTENCAHRVGKLWMTVSNWGTIGHWYDNAQIPKPDCPRSGNRSSTRIPSAEFPGGSAINYLFLGALWIGAIVDDDTLVSTGMDGWDVINEMYPRAAPFGGLIYRSTELSDPDYDPSAVSEFDIVAEYTDTLTDPNFVRKDPLDNRPHLPLGLDILQESYSWSQPEYEDFIMSRFRIRNIGNLYLNKVFLGLYFDCDVYHYSTSGGFQDDISGSYRCFDPTASESVLVAWGADNDGDPNRNDQWDERSPRGVIGVTLLDFPTEPRQSFNWWSTDGFDVNMDWGPTRVENYRELGTGGLGTPSGDRNKYFRMRNHEIDYDLLYSAIDYSDQGWLPPPSGIGPDLSGGYDSRFLLSFGSIDLAPGDSTEFAFVVAMGDNFHRNPTDFYDLFDPFNPQVLYDSLDFSDLTATILAARQLYRRLFVGLPGDVDSSGVVTVADAICLLNYLYLGGPASRLLRDADVNADCSITLADALYLIRYLFRGGASPLTGCAR